jgi:hypothetical protein
VRYENNAFNAWYRLFCLGTLSGVYTVAIIALSHRYRKSLNRLLKVCYVAATSEVLKAFFSSFFVAAINITNEANKAAGIRR